MNALDVFSLLVILLFTSLGIYHGLIKSISSLVSIIAGLFLAKNFSPALGELLSYIHVPNSNSLVGFLALFLLFFLVAKIIFLIIQKFWKKSALSSLDRVFGGVLGFTKGIVITVIVFSVMQLALPKDSAIIKDSSFIPYSNKIIITAKGLAPPGIDTYFHRGKK